MPRTRTARLALATALAVVAPLTGAAPAMAYTDPPPAPEGGGYAHAGATGTRSSLATAAPTGYSVTGIDVSNHQGTIDWATVKAGGARFAYMKATEGITYDDPYYPANVAGAWANGILAGPYHYGRPDRSDGATQADHLLRYSRYVNDGRTMLPMLDMENPWDTSTGLDDCYDLTAAEMVKWISDFVNRIYTRTGQKTMIYTSAYWFDTCTGSSTALAGNPLFIADWNGLNAPSTLPAGWTRWTLWQYSNTGALPGDQDVFNGTTATMRELTGRTPTRKPRPLLGTPSTTRRTPPVYRTPTTFSGSQRTPLATNLRYVSAWY